MNGACQQVFACAAFPRDQHGGIGGRDFLGEPLHELHFFRDADDPVEPELLLQARAQGAVVPGQLADLQCPGDHDLQLLIVDRLGDVVIGALLHRLDGRLHGSISRDDEDWYVGYLLAGGFQYLHA